MKSTINILGTEYRIEERKTSEDEFLEENGYAGYCKEDSKLIVYADMTEEKYFGKMDDSARLACRNRTLRHELIHAFLNESGLSADASKTAGAWAKHEEMVDWFAIQSPKIYKAFQELEIL